MKNPPANLNRLEIFWLVAKHGGVMAALPALPLAVEPAVVRWQIRQLEIDLGDTLFERRPFRLTVAGRHLYDLVDGGMVDLRRALAAFRARGPAALRIGADAALLASRVHPALVTWASKEPVPPLELVSGTPSELLGALQDGRLDLAITFLAGKPPLGLGCQVLGISPLALLVPTAWGISSEDHFWRQRRVAETLVIPGPGHPVSVVFARGLAQGRVLWPARYTVPALTSVPPLVVAGLGAGVSLRLLHLRRHRGVDVLPLGGFEQVQIVCLWRSSELSRLETLLQLVGQRVA